MADVKQLTSYFENIFDAKAEPFPRKTGFNQSLKKDSSNWVQNGEPGNFWKERSPNYDTSRPLENASQTSQANAVQATKRQYQTSQEPNVQITPKEGVQNGCVRDRGPLRGSNRNIAHLVGVDQVSENPSPRSYKEPIETTLNPRDESITHEKKRRWKSTTSNGSSGIYTGSFTDRRSVTGERLKDESDVCNTQRYVENIPYSDQVPLSKKFSSEPTVLQPMKQKTYSQENVFNINGSNVEIHNFESGYSEGLTASQISVFSSSEQEIRDSITAHTKVSLEEHEKCVKIPEQRRLKKARKIFEEEGFVMIMGDNGSGSSHLAWDVFSESNSKEKYNLIELSNFEKCIHSKEYVTILVDDAFGEAKLQDTALDTCLKYVKLCKRKKSSRNVKIIFTVKHHIASQCKRQLDDYRKCIVDLEDPKIQLDSDEMFEISKAILENHKEELKVKLVNSDGKEDRSEHCKGWHCISESLLSDIAEAAHPSGFPKKFKKFLDTRENIRQGLQFFTHPPEDLLEALNCMKKSKSQDDRDKFLTLSLIAICGEKLKFEDVARIDDSRSRRVLPVTHKNSKKRGKAKTKAKTCEDEIPWWIKIVNFYAKQCPKSMLESVRTGVELLRNIHIKEEVKGIYVFAAPCVKNATLITIGQDFPQYIMKLSDIQFFKEYISVDTYFGEDGKRYINIDVSDKSLCSEANDRLIELFEAGDIDSFATHKLFRHEMFAMQFLDYFGKTKDWLKSFIIISSKENAKCVLDCALHESESFNRRQHNLAKSVFLHKDWGEKIKNYREWSTQKELKIILYCCKHGDEDMYFKLRKKYNVNINYQCLLLAIKCGSYIIVEDILESISADITDDKKCKCMELALLKFAEKPMKKRTKVINVLQRFVPVDYKIKGVDPVIHTATKDGNGFVIVALEYFKGDINLINVHGKTILHEAVLKNRAAFLDIALKHGADQKKADKHGLLPIHECARHNKPYMLRLLVDSDGEIACATDSSGRQPLHHAAINSSFEAATCLISHGVDVDVVDDKKRTPLHYAAESGKGTVIHSLLEADADTTKRDGDGQSPWVIACKSQNIEGIKRLLGDENIDVNSPIDNLFPIHVVAATGNISAFKRLVGKGANINEVTLDTNDTVLHIAIKHGHDKLVENLLEIDDSLVDFKNKRNEVPLHTAAQYGNFFATNALLKAGADRSVINRKCQKPLCLAKQKLGEQTKEEDYEKYLSVYRLLDGHKTRRETAV